MKKICLYAAVLLAFTSACTETPALDEPDYTSDIRPSFTYDDEKEYVAGDEIEFVNTSTVDGTEVATCFWHFGFAGEGNWSEEFEPGPVRFLTAGTYIVKLTITGKDGNKVTFEQEVVINKVNVAPIADFTFTVEGHTVTLTDTSTDEDGVISSLRWSVTEAGNIIELEDGVGTYTFQTYGLKSVTLEVTDDKGATHNVTKTVAVFPEVTEFKKNWEMKVAEPSAVCIAPVVTVNETMGMVYFNCSEGKIMAITDSGSSAEVKTLYDSGTPNDEWMLYTAYSDGMLYWYSGGKTFGIDAVTGDVKWSYADYYKETATFFGCTPCVTPSWVIFNGSGIGELGSKHHIHAWSLDGTSHMSKAAAQGGGRGHVAMMKNNLGIASCDREMFTWIRINRTAGGDVIYNGDLLKQNVKYYVQPQVCIDGKARAFVLLKTKVYCIDLSEEKTVVEGDYTDQLTLWSQDFGEGNFEYEGCSVNSDNTVLYLSKGNVLYAIDADTGAIKAQASLPGKSVSVPAIDNLGNVHVCCDNGHYAVYDSTLNTKVYDEAIADSLMGSPTLSTIASSYVVGTREDGVYVISVSMPGFTGPADSSWPQYGYNSAHTNYTTK